MWLNLSRQTGGPLLKLLGSYIRIMRRGQGYGLDNLNKSMHSKDYLSVSVHHCASLCLSVSATCHHYQYLCNNRGLDGG